MEDESLLEALAEKANKDNDLSPGLFLAKGLLGTLAGLVATLAANAAFDCYVDRRREAESDDENTEVTPKE